MDCYSEDLIRSSQVIINNKNYLNIIESFKNDINSIGVTHDDVLEYSKKIFGYIRDNKITIDIVPNEVKETRRLICIIDKTLKIDKDSLTYIYKELSLVVDNTDDLECSALNNDYTRCKGKVKYSYDNLNEKGGNYDYKINVPLCVRHAKEIVKSRDGKTLSKGFYYESDLYK